MATLAAQRAAGAHWNPLLVDRTAAYVGHLAANLSTAAAREVFTPPELRLARFNPPLTRNTTCCLTPHGEEVPPHDTNTLCESLELGLTLASVNFTV